MARQNIYKVRNLSAAMPPALLGDLVDFLVSQRAFILPKDKQAETFRKRFLDQSYLSELVHRLVVLGKDQRYSLLKLPSKTVALREAVDMTFAPIDLYQIEVVLGPSKVVNLIPELNHQLVINISDITKANGEFSDITQFHYRVVRDFLSRSFYASPENMWVSPTLIRYVAKVYSMTLGGQISRMFRLSPTFQSFVQTVFCAFFVGQMTSLDITTTFLKVHGRYMALPDSADVTQIMAFVEDTLGKAAPESLEDVCRVIDAYDHDSLKGHGSSRLTRPVLNMRFANLYQEGQVSIIALEYPPYFLFLILLALSNVRIGLVFHMKEMNLMREGQDVMDQVIRSPSLFSHL